MTRRRAAAFTYSAVTLVLLGACIGNPTTPAVWLLLAGWQTMAAAFAVGYVSGRRDQYVHLLPPTFAWVYELARKQGVHPDDRATKN